MKTEYTFDHVHDVDSTQAQVFECNGVKSVQAVFEGYNATIMAYGQTGSGKTYTLDGFYYDQDNQDKGLIGRSIGHIFEHIEMKSNENYNYLVRVSFLQIYNHSISDLLKPSSKNLSIFEDKKSGVLVEGLSEWAVRNSAELNKLMLHGVNNRHTYATNINDLSSRSHAILIITIEQSEIKFYLKEQEITLSKYEELQEAYVENEQYAYSDIKFERKYRVGKLNLVDLAGSERVANTGAIGARLEESKKINQSLSALGNVISALVQKKAHIPYRDSKLTRLLEDSLGGNCITTFMGMVSPAPQCYAESLSTLKFAQRTKNIKNTPKINEDLDHNALLRKYQTEIVSLKEKLDRLHDDKLDNYICTLEMEHKKVVEHRDQLLEIINTNKEKLDIANLDPNGNGGNQTDTLLLNKLSSIQSDMLVGGVINESTTPSTDLHEIIQLKKKELTQLYDLKYQEKCDELEAEKSKLDDDKSQIQRYKELLLKQKDIIQALTSRLKDKDEIIEELAAKLRGRQSMEIRKNENVWAVQSIDKRESFMGEDFSKIHHYWDRLPSNITLTEDMNASIKESRDKIELRESLKDLTHVIYREVLQFNNNFDYEEIYKVYKKHELFDRFNLKEIKEFNDQNSISSANFSGKSSSLNDSSKENNNAISQIETNTMGHFENNKNMGNNRSLNPTRKVSPFKLNKKPNYTVNNLKYSKLLLATSTDPNKPNKLNQSNQHSNLNKTERTSLTREKLRNLDGNVDRAKSPMFATQSLTQKRPHPYVESKRDTTPTSFKPNIKNLENSISIYLNERNKKF